MIDLPRAPRALYLEGIYSPAMRSRWLSRAVFGLLAVYLSIGIAVGLRNTVLRLRSAARSAGLSSGEVRTRIHGPEYVAAVELIRKAIPVDEPYLIREVERDAKYWVRFDLLPRRAILDDAPTPDPLSACMQAQVRWMVMAVGTRRPPLLYERPVEVPPGCLPASWRKTFP